ncbi:ferroxidase fet3 [Coemansia sp. RSA 487]|nr:ferroxidase fet3 [Coemansia sp. RSA 1843]KAJ2215248.1 ferroxidase fet3 [Coemansia sp. RSA 487]
MSNDSISKCALHVRNSTNNVTPHYIREYMDALEAEPDSFLRTMAAMAMVPTCFCVSNLSRVGNASMDFGNGHPAWINPPQAYVPGYALILPRNKSDDGYHIFLSLTTGDMDKEVVENWDITYVNTNRGLDQPAKRGIGVNGKLPLPVVEAELGDTLVLNVHNSLNTTTSLHAHGIFQYGTNYYDGVSMVNGCPIAPNSNFTYKIKLDQAGTYWIHGHTHEQNYDGLRTPLIIHDPYSRYPADMEYLFAVEDWWPITYSETVDILRTPHNLGNPYVHPPLTLINGFSGNQTGPLKFVPGETYRIRLVSMMSLPMWEFTIDDHELVIIEVDGVYTRPKPVSAVRLSPAQRVSVLVKAKPNISSNYQYHVTVLQEYLPAIPGVYPAQFDGQVSYAKDAPVYKTKSIASEPFDDLGIESLEYMPALVPERSLFLNLTYGYTPDFRLWETINSVSFKSPPVPTIFTALTTGYMALNPITYGPQTNARVFRFGEVIEVLFWSSTIFPHPMHLHGHTFQVIEKGKTSDLTGESVRRVPSSGYSPLRRDTVYVASGEYAIVRFRANNPGVWNMHCHFDWHNGLGLNMIFVTAPALMRDVLDVPDSVYEQCRIQGIKTSGNVAGRTTYNYDGAPFIPSLNQTTPPPA